MKLLFRGLIALLPFGIIILTIFHFSKTDPINAQVGCPSLQPVVAGTNPARSQNAWQASAGVVVNIINNRTTQGVNYTFSDQEVQGIKDAFNHGKQAYLVRT
jgi:hypothetical protein